MGRYTTRLIPFGSLLLLVSKMGGTPTRALDDNSNNNQAGEGE